MPWESSRIERTLTILKGTFHGETRYYVAPFHTVNNDGQIYTEPTPADLIHSPDILRFNKLEIRDADGYGGLSTRTKEVPETTQGPAFSSAYPGKDEPE